MSKYTIAQGDKLITDETEGNVEQTIAETILAEFTSVSADNPVEVQFVSAIGPKRGFIKSPNGVEAQIEGIPVMADHTGIKFTGTDPIVNVDFVEPDDVVTSNNEETPDLDDPEIQDLLDALPEGIENDDDDDDDDDDVIGDGSEIVA